MEHRDSVREVLLSAWRQGDEEAGRQFLELVSGELRHAAGRLFLRERAHHTLQPTALVNEVVLSLLRSADDVAPSYPDFMARATRMMWRKLVDHSRRYRVRGGPGKEQFDPARHDVGAADGDGVALDVQAAMAELETQDPGKAEVIVLKRVFGMTDEEVAQARGCSVGKVKKDDRIARAWLAGRLEELRGLRR